MLESGAKCVYFALRRKGQVAGLRTSHDILIPVTFYLSVFQMKMKEYVLDSPLVSLF